MIYPILAAFLLDLVLGDPRRSTHPVVLMGKYITRFEMLLRKIFQTDNGLKFAGFLLWLTTVGLSYVSTIILEKAFFALNPWMGRAITVWFLYTTLAIKNLADEAMAIYRRLKTGDLEAARSRLSGIVGRDTNNLDIEEISRATIETVAENTVDGILSPLFFAFIGGAPLAMAFKAASTLDSMVGYKNERYMHLGWFSAKMDDVLNYIPARIGFLVMLISAAFLRLDIVRGARTVFRDAKRHSSPNSGIPEALTAGVLGIRLGGLNYYSGTPRFQNHMGDAIRKISFEDIRTVTALSVISAVITLIIGQVALYLI